MFRQDYHLHSRFSPDSFAEPEQVLLHAADEGLDDIALTEHCECNGASAIPEGCGNWPDLDIPAYTGYLEKLRENSPIPFAIGIELGQATQNENRAKEILSAYNWDFVIGSLHNTAGDYDPYFMRFDKAAPEKMMEKYFEELYRLARMGTYSVLGHLYYPLRYVTRVKPDFDISVFDEQIRQILRTVVEKGKGIELNVKGLDSDPCGAVPDMRHLKMYRQLGGEIITFGSDDHTGYPGKNLEKGYDMLRQAGFRAIAKFRSMKPEFKDI